MGNIPDRMKKLFTSKAGIGIAAVLVLCILIFGVVYGISKAGGDSGSKEPSQNAQVNAAGANIQTDNAQQKETKDMQDNGQAQKTTGGTVVTQTENFGQTAGNTAQAENTGQPAGSTAPAENTGQPAGSTAPAENTGQPAGSTAQAGNAGQPAESTAQTGNAGQPAGSTAPIGSATQPAESTAPAGNASQSTTAPTQVQTKAPTTAPVNAEAILAGMTLEEKVGQMFIARCPDSNAEQLAGRYQPGGYILFARDFRNKTKQQVIDTINKYQQVSKVPMLIGVDEEGGKVNRVSMYTEFRSQPFMSPQELFALGGYDMVKSDTTEKSRLLKSLGINMNFAPVADVSENPQDFIYQRTFGKNANETSQYISTVVSTMKQEKMGSVLKHFPGYGNNSDTHTGIAYDSRSYENFQTSDFLPFKAGVASGADAIMVAHNIVYCMDITYPASLSQNVHRILREETGFNGVIITDELSMAGISRFVDDENAAVLAVLAGNDLLCCTNFESQINAVVKAVNEGRIPESRINESVLRILNMKFSLGIIKK